MLCWGTLRWVSCFSWDPCGPLNPPCSLCPGRFWFRLYWFPLKVLYATCYSSLQSVPNIPFYFFFNALLLVLTLMNIYWFLVSRGSSATPTLASPSSAAPACACCLPVSGAAGVEEARRTWGWLGGEEGSPCRCLRCSSALEFRPSRTPGIRGEGSDGSSWGSLELGVGVTALALPKLWGGGGKGGLGGLLSRSSTLGRAGQRPSSSSYGAEIS